MASLLEVATSPVTELSLDRLSKNRVQWLLKLVRRQQEGNSGDHHELQPLNGVLCESSLVQIKREGKPHRGHGIKHRLLAHALYRERNGSQIERTAQNLFANTFQDFLPRRPEPCLKLLVLKRKATIRVPVISSPVIKLLEGLESFGLFLKQLKLIESGVVNFSLYNREFFIFLLLELNRCLVLKL